MDAHNDTMKKQTKSMARQGDLLIVEIDSLPTGLIKVPLENGKVILAHGEISGHCHSIQQNRKTRRTESRNGRPNATLYTDENGVSILEVADALANLVHDEHATIPLKKGIYRVIRQREYVRKEIRRVAD